MKPADLLRPPYLILMLALAAALAVLSLPPIPQDPAYHDFADRRVWIGIPNFLDVATNIAFLFVGLKGMMMCLRGNHVIGARRAWLACFTGVTWVAFGSGYYHLAPDDASLVWDRLPMSIAFMGLLVAVLSENLLASLEKMLLWPAILFGIASVITWYATGDLRFYVLVQFMPLLLLPAILLFGARPNPQRNPLIMAMVVYLLSKLAEYFDRAIFILSGKNVSGHSLKHLLAALALFVLYRMLRRRQYAGDEPA